MKIKIGVSLRVVNAQNYKEKRDSLSHDWAPLLEKLDIIPILVPNTISDVPSFLENIGVDGILLSGGDNIGDNPERDRIEEELIKYGIDHGLPIFGVCRGMQVINKKFGGSIINTADGKHVGRPHTVGITNTDFSSLLHTKTVQVNSFHNNIIQKDGLGTGLEPFAIFNTDKTVEGFFHKEHPVIGVMWHPEREPNSFNENILRKVFHEKHFWKNRI